MQSVRWTAMTVDMVLHDYAAGAPRALCTGLAHLSRRRRRRCRPSQFLRQEAPPSFTTTTDAVAVDEAHRGGEERVLWNAWDALREAGYWQRCGSGPLESMEAAAELWAASSLASVTRRASDLTTDPAVVVSTRPSLPSSLLGLLPASGLQPSLSSKPCPTCDGGLPDAQKAWWVADVLRYWEGEWWLARAVTPRRMTQVPAPCMMTTSSLSVASSLADANVCEGSYLCCSPAFWTVVEGVAL